MSISTSRYAYRFIYFDVRGVGELCRLVLAVSDFEWKDIRYPMRVAADGFSYGPEFRRDADTGAFAGNMNNLPVLQVIDPNNPGAAIATIGQSHTIARFIARQHPTLGGRDHFEEARVDAIYECCRDIKSTWYRAKRVEGGKKTWFDTAKPSEGDNLSDSSRPSLKGQCELLENALNSYGTVSSSSSQWCLGGPDPTLADISIYHLLATPMSPISGSTASFFDGENERVLAAYSSFPRLRATVSACANLKSIQRWESERPDTFT